jgi:hypothetical protein
MRGANESRYRHCEWTKITGPAATTRPARLSQPLDQTQGAGQWPVVVISVDLLRGDGGLHYSSDVDG